MKEGVEGWRDFGEEARGEDVGEVCFAERGEAGEVAGEFLRGADAERVALEVDVGYLSGGGREERRNVWRDIVGGGEFEAAAFEGEEGWVCHCAGAGNVPCNVVAVCVPVLRVENVCCQRGVCGI